MITLIKALLESIKTIPGSTLFILLITLAVNLATSLANRLTMDVNEYRRWSIEFNRVSKELKKAMAKGDRKRVARLKKRQRELMEVQSKLMARRGWLWIVFLVPMFVLWRVLVSMYGGLTVAYIPLPVKLPFRPPPTALGTEIGLTLWYFIASFAVSIPISRALGLTFEMED